MRPANSYSRSERTLAKLGNIIILLLVGAFCLGLIVGAWLW